MNLLFLRLWHTWSGGNEYAWDGKGPAFEADMTCSYSNGKYFVSKNCQPMICLFSICRLSCHIVFLLT